LVKFSVTIISFKKATAPIFYFDFVLIQTIQLDGFANILLIKVC